MLRRSCTAAVASVAARQFELLQAVASNCMAVLKGNIFVFILAPLTPPALSRPAGRKRELTAIFGRVYKAIQYTCHGALRWMNQLSTVPTCFSSVYFLAFTRGQIWELAPLWLLGSDTNFAAAQCVVPCGPAEGCANLGSDPKNQRGGGDRVGPKQEKNKNPSLTTAPSAGQDFPYFAYRAALPVTSPSQVRHG